MLEHTSVNRAACAAAARYPALLATDLADYLVQRSVPFRQAHHAVGMLVATAEHLGKSLQQLTLIELRAVEPKFDADALRLFELKPAMARRRLPGSPGTAEVKKQLARWRRLLWASRGTA